VAIYPFCRRSGLKDPVVPLYPAAQTIASPGAVETDVSALGLPWFGLVTVVQAVPFQFSVSVCAEAAPAGVSWPTAHRLFGALSVTPVRALFVPGEGLGTMLQAVPL
jgi:hypothetical protein